MGEALRVLQAVRDLHINPFAAVVAAAIAAAWLEQKLARSRTAHFTSDHQGVIAKGRPGKPRP